MYLQNFGRKEVIQPFIANNLRLSAGRVLNASDFCYAPSALAVFSFKTKISVLLVIGNGRTSPKSLASQIQFVMQYRSLRGSLIGGQSKSQLYNFAHLSFKNRFSFWLDVFFTSFRFDEYSFRLRSELA